MVKDTKDRDEKYELIKTCCPCCDNLTEGSYQVITDIPKKLYCSQCGAEIIQPIQFAKVLFKFK
mgnify:CR=1 FL=1